MRPAYSPRPGYTIESNTYDYLYVGPADAATIYDTPNRAENPNATGATYDGTGAIIGIVGDSDFSLEQNANYRKIFGLTAAAPTVIVDGANPGTNGDALEAYLDTQVAGGIAPGAEIDYYTAANTTVDDGLDLAIVAAVNANRVDVLNVSFGECEASLGTASNAYYSNMWEQAAAQGISVVVSAGDSGSAGCDDENTVSTAQLGLEVNGLASTPYDIAVGGTDFAVLAGPDELGGNFTNYVSEANNGTTRGSARGYIPEVPWNNSTITFPPGTESTNQPLPDPYGNIVAGGGGRSNCAVGDIGSNLKVECTSGYAKPSWQSPALTYDDHVRDVPDVSLFAGNAFDFAIWGICSDEDTDSNNNPVTDCTPGSDGLPAADFNLTGVGGTSAAAPAFAGILALVKQKTGERQGQANNVLYQLAQTVPAVFHDVTGGNNSVPCTAGSLNCTKNSEGDYYLTGYDAGAGYDLASGLGSVDASLLVSNWTSVALGTTTTTLSLNPTTLEHGTVVTAKATVVASNGTATGDVALTSVSTTGNMQPTALGTLTLGAGGIAEEGINYLPGGSYKVIATYSGSTSDAGSVSAPVPVTVTPEPSVVPVNVTAENPYNFDFVTDGTAPYGYVFRVATQPYGIHSPTDGGVKPDGIATGTVRFSTDGLNLGTFPLGTTGLAGTSGTVIGPGSHTYVAAYSGDPSFDPNTGSLTVTTSKAATTSGIVASTNVYTGTPIVVTLTVNTVSAGVAPTGVVTLVSGNTVLGSANIAGTAGTDTVPAAATASISLSTTIPAGESTVTAVYAGDANYGGSTSPGIGLKGRSYFTLSNNGAHLPGEHTTAAAYIVTTSKGGYAGTIHYTCALLGTYKEADLPDCGMYPATEMLTVNGQVTPEMLVFGKGTKLPIGVTLGSNSNQPKGLRRSAALGIGLGGAGAALACGLLFGIPARRRGWKSMLSVILLLAALGGFTACVATPKMISSGVYEFRVTAVDSKDTTNTASTTVKVTVL